MTIALPGSDPVQLMLLRFLSIVECSAARSDDPAHHLRRKPSGLYQMRLTIDRGPKYVGERVTVGLGTRNRRKAAARRDIVLDALRKAMMVRG